MPKVRTIAFLVAAATSLVDHNDSVLAQAQPCYAREYAHNAYTVCEVDLGKHTVRLYWKRSDGTPYAYLSSLPRVLEHTRVVGAWVVVARRLGSTSRPNLRAPLLPS